MIEKSNYLPIFKNMQMFKIPFDWYLTGKDNPEGSFCPQRLYDGHVIERPPFNNLVLKIIMLVCDGHVIEPLLNGKNLCNGYVTRNRFCHKSLMEVYLMEGLYSFQKAYNRFVKESIYWTKLLCDGYVTKSRLSKINPFKTNTFLCDWHVIKTRVRIKFLSKRYVTESTKRLFDGYLLEIKN